MPTFVMAEKCDGCKGQDKTACMYACPNDLMVLDKEKMKAYNRDPWACWECLCCAKACPQQAMDLSGYKDFVPLGASCTPLRGSEDIMWTIKFRNGMVKRFKFPIRTTEEGSAVPDGGFGNGEASLDSVELYTEPTSIGVPVWTFKK
ncbi:MAG: adenylylsulfate reductase [Peptococcaceae bacterium BRH_c4a]|nr:MAG: adenylylsulfate reductase [Peptococcaceae bacterium BRH_c4a]